MLAYVYIILFSVVSDEYIIVYVKYIKWFICDVLLNL